jgi:hypothetical protein
VPRIPPIVELDGLVGKVAATIVLVCLLGVGFRPAVAGNQPGAEEYSGISALELLANGRLYDGWPVRVRGVLSISRTDGGYRTYLFISQEHYRLPDPWSAIGLAFADELLSRQKEKLLEASGRYVEVYGVFDYRGRTRGRPGIVALRPDPSSGAITDISEWAVIEPSPMH